MNLHVDHESLYADHDELVGLDVDRGELVDLDHGELVVLGVDHDAHGLSHRLACPLGHLLSLVMD